MADRWEVPPAAYSSASGTSAMFFSPAAFFSLYAFTQSSQCLPAARSLPLNSSAGNLGVAHFALLRRVGSEVLHEGLGQRRAGLAVEDVGLDPLAVLERQRHIAAIVQGLFESLAQILVAGQRGHPAFKLLVLGPRSQFQRLDLFAAYTSALLRSCVGLLKLAVGLRDLHQRRRPMRRCFIQQIQRVLVLVQAEGAA